MSYQEKLKIAMIESFGELDEELYNGLKENIIPLEYITKFIELVSDFYVNTIKQNNKPCCVDCAKMMHNIILFITKMQEIYPMSLLENVRFKNSVGTIYELDFEGKCDKFGNIRFYEKMHKHFKETKDDDIRPFDFILYCIATSIKHTMYLSEYPCMLYILENHLKGEYKCTIKTN